MNKTELINTVSEIADISIKDAATVINATLDTITKALADGDKVQIVGFGSFETRERKAHQGRNPQTGEIVTINACRVPAFKAGKALKDNVNK